MAPLKPPLPALPSWLAEHSGHSQLSTAIPPASELQPKLPDYPVLTPRLLVSIRNSHEARLARLGGVAWIDLKNPESGSLGAADEVTAAAVARELQQRGDTAQSPNRLTSAAVGELRDLPRTAAESLARHFPLLKVGLSGLRDSRDWPQRLREFSKLVKLAGARLVPVIYADHVACRAPAPSQVIEVAGTLWDEHVAGPPADTVVGSPTALPEGPPGSPLPRYLLVDTFTKDGRRLLDWMQPAELGSLLELARISGRQTVVAGSLALQDLPHLMPLPIAAVAVRGAVCRGDRRSSLCPEKLRHWVELFSAR